MRLSIFGNKIFSAEQGKSPLDFPADIDRDWICQNGLAVATGLTDQSIAVLRHAYGHRRKFIFSQTFNFTQTGLAPNYIAGDAPNNASEEWWSFHCHTGYGAKQLLFFSLLLPPDGRVTTENPSVRWEAFDEDGVSIGFTDYAFGPRGDFPTVLRPVGVGSAITRFDCEENTTYSFTMEVNGFTRPMAISVWEIPEVILSDTNDGVSVDTTTYRGQITADDYYDMFRQAERLRTKNGAVLFNYNRKHRSDTAQTFSGATWTNIIDGSTGFGNVGYYIDLSGADSLSGRGVGVRLAVKGRTSAASVDPTLGVRMIDSSGALVGSSATVQGFLSTTSEWRTSEFLLTELTGPIEIQARGSAGEDFILDALSLYQYEAGDVYALPALPPNLDYWNATHESIDPPIDGHVFNHSIGFPANGFGGDIDYDEVSAGTPFNFQVAVPGVDGLVGMEAVNQSSWMRDSNSAHHALGAGPFTDLGFIYIANAPTFDQVVFSKRDPGGTQQGTQMSFRNDGQILAVYDPGGLGSAGFENIDQGLATDLIGLWAVAQVRNVAGEEYIFLRKHGGAAQSSTPTVRTDDYDSAAALWMLGRAGTGAPGAIYVARYEFDRGVPVGELTTLTDWMDP